MAPRSVFFGVSRSAMSYMRNAILFRKSEVPVCWRALFARFPPSAHRASQLRTYSFAHTQPTRKTTVLPRPAQRNRGPGPSFALAAHFQRTLWSLWQVFKAQQGEKTRVLEATLEPEGTKSGFSSACLPLRQEFHPWCAISASRFT